MRIIAASRKQIEKLAKGNNQDRAMALYIKSHPITRVQSLSSVLLYVGENAETAETYLVVFTLWPRKKVLAIYIEEPNEVISEIRPIKP